MRVHILSLCMDVIILLDILQNKNFHIFMWYKQSFSSMTAILHEKKKLIIIQNGR